MTDRPDHPQHAPAASPADARLQSGQAGHTDQAGHADHAGHAECGGVTRRMVALPSGLRLHAAYAGAGPVVLLIHGFPQTWWCWRHVVPLLAADHLVIAPDYRGAGLSDRPLGGTTSGRWRPTCTSWRRS